MSEEPELSTPRRALASACEYQVLATSAPGKSRGMVFGPACPRSAEPGLQKSGSKLASTRIVTELLRMPAHWLAAFWKAFNRSAPSVTPGLPPSGARGVASLNPSPPPSRLLIVNVV